jgi:tRNA dimethylallyltransferase
MRSKNPASRPTAILIAGPTASGKSELAARLAQRYGGVVINADSMQVYRGLPILTAQPDDALRASTQHLLYGHVPPERAYSVAQWLNDVDAILKQIARHDEVPVFVGGTGLYFRALEMGLSPIPEPNPEIRRYWRDRAMEGGPALHLELERRDPKSAARIAPGDTQRIVRSLEVFDSTGKSISSFRSIAGKASPVLYDAQRMVLHVPTDVLAQRIDARFNHMMAEGALAEVQAIASLDLDPRLPAMKAIGVPQLLKYLGGEMSLTDAIEAAKIATRRFAKRQRTWFRNQLDERWPWIMPDNLP